MGDEPDTASETLFSAEFALRVAAKNYAEAQSNDNRKYLRAAALRYADVANQIDEQVEFKP